MSLLLEVDNEQLYHVIQITNTPVAPFINMD